MTQRKRDYKREYAMYQGTEEQKKNRAKRNTARRRAIKKYGKAALKGKDVDHIKPLIKGGTNAPSNLRVISASKNRSHKLNKKSK